MFSSHHSSEKIQIVAGNTWGNEAKHCWVMSTNFLFSKVSNAQQGFAFKLHLKQTLPPIIWIFTEGKGDEIESMLPFKIFSTFH